MIRDDDKVDLGLHPGRRKRGKRPRTDKPAPGSAAQDGNTAPPEDELALAYRRGSAVDRIAAKVDGEPVSHEER